MKTGRMPPLVDSYCAKRMAADAAVAMIPSGAKKLAMPMIADGEPAWRVSWRERGQGGSGETAPVSAVAAAVPPQRPTANYQGFVEPLPWLDDGGKWRETVLDVDHNPPRVVRVVGWLRCIKCSRRFFSDDVRAVRMCPVCKNVKDQRKPQRW